MHSQMNNTWARTVSYISSLLSGASLRRTLDVPSHLAASILLLSHLCPGLGFLIQRPCQSCWKPLQRLEALQLSHVALSNKA